MASSVVQGRRQAPVRSGEVIRNFDKKILMIDPEGDPRSSAFLSFFSRVGVEKTSTETVRWQVQDHVPTKDVVIEAVGSSDSEIKVANPNYFLPNHLWKVKRTGEIFHVLSTNTSNGSISVSRAVTYVDSSQGSAAQSIVVGDILIRLGPAVTENSRRQVAQSTVPSEEYNHLQIFRYDIESSRRQQKREMETENDMMSRLEQRQLYEAKKDINATLLAGERSSFHKDGSIVTTTQGMMGVPKSHVWRVPGVMYGNDLDEFLREEGGIRGSMNKVLISSSHVLGAFSQMTKDGIQLSTIPSPAGAMGIPLKVGFYTCPVTGLTLTLVEDRFLTKHYPGEAIGVDFHQVKKVVFSSGGIDDDLKLYGETQDADDFGKVSTIYGDIGLKWGVEQTHFRITGVEAGAAGRSI